MLRRVSPWSASLFLPLLLAAACAGPSGVGPVPQSQLAAQPSSPVAPSVEPRASAIESPHTRLGVPRPLQGLHTRDVVQDRGEFVLSYDEEMHLARWVAWRVRKEDLGRVKRKNQFRADTGLPTGFLKIDTSDYAHTGYDRGHLCPSGDRTASEEANQRTFLMTNMHPQKHALNAGPWEELEEQTRALLKRPDDVVYVVAGPLLDATPARIGRGVAVPRASFKALIALKDGQGPHDVRETVYHAAAIMPNDDTAEGQHWRSYETSIREVESASGYDFFPAIPGPTQAALEASRGTP